MNLVYIAIQENPGILKSPTTVPSKAIYTPFHIYRRTVPYIFVWWGSFGYRKTGSAEDHNLLISGVLKRVLRPAIHRCFSSLQIWHEKCNIGIRCYNCVRATSLFLLSTHCTTILVWNIVPTMLIKISSFFYKKVNGTDHWRIGSPQISTNWIKLNW